MTDPRSRAQAARSYLEMLGIRGPRRRRPVVDGIEIGEARIEAPSTDERALEAMNRTPSGAPAPSSTRRAELALSIADDEIPAEWVRGGAGAESQASANEREAAERRRAAQEAAYERTRDAAYDRSFVEGLEVDNRLPAVHEGVMQGLTFGFADELAGAGRSAVHGGSYRDARDSARADADVAREGAPGYYAGAEILGSLPATALVPSAGPSASLLRRVLFSGATGAGFGGVSGAGHSRHDYDTDEFRGDVARETAIGGAMGAGFELGAAGVGRVRDAFRAAPEGTPAPGRDFTPEQQADIRSRRDTDPETWNLARERELAEDAAATRRVRSTADSAALSDVRRAGDYHGPGGEGYRGLARDLDETGIMPRRSLGSAADAQTRAARIQEESGEQLGRVRQRMDDAVMSLDPEQRLIANTDEDLARIADEGRDRLAAQAEREAAAARAEAASLEEPTGGARGGRRRPQGVSMRERPSDATDIEPVSFEDLNTDTTAADEVYSETFTPEQAREAVVLRNDPALVRYSDTITRLDDAGRAHQVPAGTAAERLRAEAAEALASATTREQRASAAQLKQLADDMESLDPEVYSRAQARLRALDEEAAYGTRYPNAQGASPERTSRARSARQGVRADMDLAVERTLGPEALRDAQGARGRYGTARAVEVMSERGAEREAANLQAGLGDTLAIHAGLSRQGTLTDRLWNAVEGVVVNRYLRGRGHAAIATLREMQSDALAAAVVRRLNAQPATTAVARQLEEAARRGPRAFGVTLHRYMQRDPEIASVVAEEAQLTGDMPAEEDPTGGIGAPLEDIDENDPTGGL